MSGAQTDQTLIRLDAAISRIEAALNRPVAKPSPHVDDSLVARHEGLRRAVAESLRELDNLITVADPALSPSATEA